MKRLRELVLTELVVKKQPQISIDCSEDDYWSMKHKCEYMQSIGINAAIPWHRETIQFSLKPFEQKGSRSSDDANKYYDEIYNAKEEDKYKFMEVSE